MSNHPHRHYDRSGNRAALLCAVADAVSVTCASLTEVTGLSTMTVKRGVDELVAERLLSRVKSPTGDDGRRGHRLSLHPRLMRLVLDLTSPTMVCHSFIGADPMPVTVTSRFDASMTFEENLQIHVSRGIAAMGIAAGGRAPGTMSATEGMLGAVAVCLPELRPQVATSLYHEAYKRAMATRGSRLWEDLAEAVQIMGKTTERPTIHRLGEDEALVALAARHPATRETTVLVCLDDTPAPHAALLVRRDPSEAWFIPTGSQQLPLKELYSASAMLLATPQVVLTHGVTVPRGLAEGASTIRLPLPLRVYGAAYRSLERIATEG